MWGGEAMRYLLAVVMVGCGASCGWADAATPAGQLNQLLLKSELVPSPVAVDVLTPPGYTDESEPVPLLIWLHGGTSGKDYLGSHLRRYIEKAWAENDLSRCVVVAPVTGASFFIDWRDGTNQWDSFITGPMLSDIRKNYRVKQTREGTAIGGSSFGGQGSLRVAFRHPQLFQAVVSVAPGFPAVLRLEDWDISYFNDEVLAQHAARFGDPIERTFWRQTHPPTLVIDRAQELRESGLQILLEVGDEDANGNFRSAELLHRLLFDAAIEHDYHLHRGAAHVGRSKEWRYPEVFRFLSRCWNPPQQPDPAAERHRRKAIERGRYKPRTTNELPLTPVEFPAVR